MSDIHFLLSLGVSHEEIAQRVQRTEYVITEELREKNEPDE
ncbi:helix-turn-helix DNA binding domain protein [Arthrobacter phage EastWest]|uniref:Helix-turn-helix DNA binding domain protein n=1 Tax=Arthrobacter phage EastWest TaxID=2894292 RepID=A0AAE9C8U5_9CAUD|nr:helix-turn-helix DNA binding domain protein [Arthrobacter phage EastWest]